MDNKITASQLVHTGIPTEQATILAKQLTQLIGQSTNPDDCWQQITTNILAKQHLPFACHLMLFSIVFPEWRTNPSLAPAWLPTKDILQGANIMALACSQQIDTIADLQQWSTQDYAAFWEWTIHRLGIVFKETPTDIIANKDNVTSPTWLPGASLNIVDSCFTASHDQTAVIYPDKNGDIQRISYGYLYQLVNQIAASFIHAGFKSGDAIGICMPMNLHAVATYLGIIKMGGIVVSIADSFSSQEIATRLRISNANAIVTQDQATWAGKTISLYPKVNDAVEYYASSCKIIVLPQHEGTTVSASANTIHWHDFLTDDIQHNSHPCQPMQACNILFSSGTTADPKAIVWNHTTPIKAASDAFYHQDIKPNDVLAWPTNLGWMMGPWLIFAALINKATIALYPDAPKDENFGQYVQDTKVTMLGVVPTLVATWRESQCMEALDWHTIKVFSSTGECSNAEDMLYLMYLANYKPVIEYCGGTEIGGSYITSTVVQPNYPSLFTTPTMGMNITIIDEAGHPADQGEVAIIPPSMGLSTELLNANHDKVYFDNMPNTVEGIALRRHGDQLKRFPNHTYCMLGRSDDTMNLGGIKTSAAEIERAISNVDHIIETAAIAIAPPNNGPSRLVVYAVTAIALDPSVIKSTMQQHINKQLNPLFKIHELIFVDALPKTASNKIMRRTLRDKYEKHARIGD